MASWTKLTYYRRLFIGLVAYSAVLVGSFAIFQYYREKDFKAEELNARLQIINDRILEDLSETDSVHIPSAIQPHSFEGLRISIINTEGKVLHDNSLDSLPGSNHLGRKEIADAMKNGEGYTIRRHSESTGQNYFYSAKRRGEYIVRSAIPYSVTLHQLLSADYGFLWFTLGMTALMCLIGYFAVRRIGIHIDRLNRFAEKAERGEQIFDSDPFPHDELGEISANIIRLYARLQQAIADRDKEHRQALHQEQEKIRIKRELTNNLNHELKTPVAAIHVCLETLISHPDMQPQKRDEFIMRSFRASERLSQLLADISSITRLEEGGANIVSVPVVIADIAAEVCEEFAVTAAEQNVVLRNNIRRGAPIPGNAALLASVFRNLIGNALAYSGASEIVLDCKDLANRLVITVDDNGCGVPPEHLPRLFERFYRVDKGRSRQAGGTGLGLSIVKNAVIWHGGTVRVENRRCGGLRVTFTLPASAAGR